MIIGIRENQLEIMREAVLKSMCLRLKNRLLSDRVVEEVDLEEVSQIVTDVAQLGIYGDENCYRLLRFRFLAKRELESSAVQDAVMRVLHNLAWSVDKRLTFLEREITGRNQVV